LSAVFCDGGDGRRHDIRAGNISSQQPLMLQRWISHFQQKIHSTISHRDAFS
jgi:hypothetical protein